MTCSIQKTARWILILALAPFWSIRAMQVALVTRGDPEIEPVLMTSLSKEPGVVLLDRSDIVRHPLVQAIVNAYEDAEPARPAAAPPAGLAAAAVDPGPAPTLGAEASAGPPG